MKCCAVLGGLEGEVSSLADDPDRTHPHGGGGQSEQGSGQQIAGTLNDYWRNTLRAMKGNSGHGKQCKRT